jgi:2-C-methyl-D-erythritol 4-phosphate cytidylyltransferase
MDYSFLFLAAGKGTRMRQSIPKQFLNLAGKPLLMHSLERIENIESIKEVLIITCEEYVQIISSMLENRHYLKNYSFVKGGETRQESVLNGLMKAEYPNIIIHEASRPFVLEKDFTALIDSPQENITYAINIPFTVLEGREKVDKILDRSKLLNIQLPQKYCKADILEAHIQAEKEKRVFTEDASLLFCYSKKSIIVLEGSA